MRPTTIHFPASFRVLKALIATLALCPSACVGFTDGAVRDADAGVPRPRIVRPPARVNRATLAITGYGRAGDMVHLYVNGSETQVRPVDRDGSFRFDSVELRPGRNIIAAIAEDRDGRRSSGSVSGSGGLSASTGKTSWKVIVNRE